MAAACPSTITVVKIAHPLHIFYLVQNCPLERTLLYKAVFCTCSVKPITENWQVVKAYMCQKRLQSHDVEPKGLNAKFF